MRIVVLSHCAARGGAEKVATLLANHLVEQKNDVFFFAVHFDEIQYPLDPRITYAYSGVEGGGNVQKQLRRILAVRRYVKKVKPDAVVSLVNVESVGLIGVGRTKIICSLRNDPNRYYHRGLKKMLRNIAYAQADAMVFQTEQARNYFHGQIARKGTIIVNPVQGDLPYWQPDKVERYLMTACRLNEQKNLPMMIRAFGIFHGKRPKYQLRIYGEGEKKGEVERLIADMALQGVVQLMDNSHEIYDAMQKASLFLLSSNYEGISNSMLEALAIGLPCVCTDCPVGGAAMFVEDGVNGYLAPVGDAERFAELMEKACAEFEDSDTRSTALALRERLNPEDVFCQWLRLIACTVEGRK